MSGPHILDTRTINNVVPESIAGAYILSKDGKTANYVGRSDSDMASRLSSYVGNSRGYSYFWYETTSSAKSAFDLECSWWHKYRPDNNQNHPDRPNKSDWQCPQCNLFEIQRGWY